MRVAAAALLVAAATTQVDAAEPLIEIAAATTVTATGSAPVSLSIELQLPADSSLPLGWGTDIVIDSDSDLMAGVMVQHLCEERPGGICEQVGYHQPQDTVRCTNDTLSPLIVSGCQPLEHESWVQRAPARDDRVDLPAGRYRIVLYGDGTHITATLPFGGLAGNVSIATEEPAGISLAALTGTPDVAGIRPVSSDERTGTLPWRGTSWIFTHQLSAAASSFTVCSDRPSDHLDAPVRCPGHNSLVGLQGDPTREQGTQSTGAGPTTYGMATSDNCLVSDCSAGDLRWTYRGFAIGPGHAIAVAIWSPYCFFSCDLESPTSLPDSTELREVQGSPWIIGNSTGIQDV